MLSSMSTRLGASLRLAHGRIRDALKRRSHVTQIWRSFGSSVGAALPTTSIGILRETYDKWERRAPLTPNNVRRLLAEHPHNRLSILIQPSTQRIFSDHAYEEAGAVVTEDLSLADIFLGVKRPEISDLIPSKTYVCFSHTLKGQPSNMPLLQECLNQHIQLLDYERMMDAKVDDVDSGVTPMVGADNVVNLPRRNPKRLVSFGRFAGMAGALDSMAALGKRLLYTRGITTPFLYGPPAWMQPTVDDAKASMRRIGSMIHNDGIASTTPIVFTITGQGGCVHGGVMEILRELPHEIVHAPDLQNLSATARAADNVQQHVVYLAPVGLSDVFQRSDGAVFDRNDFQQHPSHYRPTLAQTILPYTDVIFNAVYWDARFPRLLTKKQVKRWYEKCMDEASRRLLLLVDVSCDIQGSMEILDRTTTIESPFYQYDPLLEKEVATDIGEKGITVMGVDILPTELPKESSEHFGQVVESIVPELMKAHQVQSEDGKIQRGLDPQKLSPRLIHSCITTADGQLMPSYIYLEALMSQSPALAQQVTDKSMTISMEGHLFDSGLINHVVDVVEQEEGAMQIEECRLPPFTDPPLSRKSAALIRITARDQDKLHGIERKLQALVDALPKAETVITRVDPPATDPAIRPNGREGRALVESLPKMQRVLVLGSGHVSKTMVEYLGRSNNVQITVASDVEAEARRIASVAHQGKHVGLNVVEHPQQLASLVEDSDVVVSLLPAPMHPTVAHECIIHKTHLVTASYESDAMRSLEQRAQESGIIILNEVGLDPGLDHMSAMKIIDDVKLRGGTVTAFSSVCGGLPAPDSANNPLKYKFSWNPRGLIRACQNDAQYRWEGQLQEVRGYDLLRAAAPFVEAWPELHLECLPNRDSLWYETAYGIEGARTVFRGTLRYRGFSALMSVFQDMGLLDSTPITDPTWDEVIHSLRMRRGGFDSLRDYVEACADEDADVADQAMAALEWLGLLAPTPVGESQEVVEEFCHVLERKMQFEGNERDMVLMHHRIEAEFDNGTTERCVSRLQVFGDSPSSSAMAKTVGYTTAAATELILDGQLRDQRGLLLPTIDQIYLPILSKLGQEGIIFEERVYIDTSHVDKSAY